LRKNCVRVLTLFFCIFISNIAVGQIQNACTIRNIATIEYSRSYVCGNYNSTHYYAKNNITDKIEIISSDAITVINYALNSLTAGRTWKEKVSLHGNFSLNNFISLPSFTILVINGTLTTSSTSIPLIKVTDKEIIEIHGGSLVLPPGTNRPTIWLNYATDVLIEDAEVRGSGAIKMEYSNRITVKKCNLLGIESCAVVLLDSSNDIILTQNKISGTIGKVIQGILTQGSLGCTGVLIEGNEIAMFGGVDGAHGVYIGIAATHDVNITDNYFHDAFPNSGCAIRFDGSHGYISQNRFWNLQNCLIVVFVGTTLTTSVVTNVTIIKNTVQNAVRGFYIYARNNNTTKILVLENEISNCSDFGVMLFGESGKYVEKCTIADNVIYNCTNYGIRLNSQTFDNTVTRNNVISCGRNILDEGVGNHVYDNNIG
jgi:parallel beta-helix repeat protein